MQSDDELDSQNQDFEDDLERELADYLGEEEQIVLRVLRPDE